MLDVEISRNHLTLNGVRIDRPRHIHYYQWLLFGLRAPFHHLDANLNDVAIEGQIIPRPRSVSVGEWLQFWDRKAIHETNRASRDAWSHWNTQARLRDELRAQA